MDGNTNALIPLFAIGVFIGFTLSQAGLVVHWRRTRPPGWRRRAAVNGLGAMVTASPPSIFLVTKFLEGAWVVVVAIPPSSSSSTGSTPTTPGSATSWGSADARQARAQATPS